MVSIITKIQFALQHADSEIGRSIMIVPRAVAQQGYMDVDLDDFDQDGYFKDTQEVQLRIIKDQWLDGEALQKYK